MNLKKTILNLARRLGYDIVQFNQDNPLWRRIRLFEDAGINHVLDVGANSGDYGHALRSFGYSGRITSFEPLPEAFAELAGCAASDPLWTYENLALGDKQETRKINIAGNSVSSSFLDMLPAHLNGAPDSAYVGQVAVPINRLIDIFGRYIDSDDRVYLKIDTQGYEKNVLIGAGDALKEIKLIQIEASLRPLYDSAFLADEAIQFLRGHSFEPVSFEPGFADPVTGHQLQANIIFKRTGIP
tara:strand:- start:1117 stop:1842 length:726 start_codon:yes stop_codon:yes gene_type:complete